MVASMARMVPGYAGSDTARRPPARARRARARRRPRRRSAAAQPATTARRAAARRWRNEPSNGPCRRRGSKRRPRDGHALGERAHAAAGHAGEADALAEVHQRLRGRRREVVAGALRDAPHVDVDRQHVAAEGEAGDRVGGVAADAGQLGQVVRPAVSRDLLRGAVERERAPVVAEPLPLADHVGGRSGGERLDGRPALEPAPPARQDALHLRLLRHHLADEDRVRVLVFRQGRSAPVSAEPGQEQLFHRREPRPACYCLRSGRTAPGCVRSLSCSAFVRPGGPLAPRRTCRP